jgi:hypothetical protein
MSLAVLATRAALADGGPRVLRLVASVAAGALAYVAFLFAVHRHRLVQYFTRIRASFAGSTA